MFDVLTSFVDADGSELVREDDTTLTRDQTTASPLVLCITLYCDYSSVCDRELRAG